MDALYTMISFYFFFFFLFMVAFVSTLGVFPNVASEQHIFKEWNLESVREFKLSQRFRILCWLTSGNNFNDLSQITHVDNKI